MLDVGLQKHTDESLLITDVCHSHFRIKREHSSRREGRRPELLSQTVSLWARSPAKQTNKSHHIYSQIYMRSY